MTEPNDEIDAVYAHERKMATIEARKAAFARAPFIFVFWDIVMAALNVGLWLCFWLLIAQCACHGCIL